MTATLAQALVAAQQEMPKVDKDAKNPHFNSAFVSLDHLIATTRPVLNRHGLAIIQLPIAMEGGGPGLRTTILHSESGDSQQADMPLFLQKQDMQGYGSALTYARRYAWASALGIASEDDDDGNVASAPATEIEDEIRQEFQSPVAANGSTITEPQQKRLFAISKKNSLEEDVVKRLIKEVAGVGSSAEIPRSKYDAVIEAIEAEGVPF